MIDRLTGCPYSKVEIAGHLVYADYGRDKIDGFNWALKGRSQ